MLTLGRPTLRFVATLEAIIEAPPPAARNNRKVRPFFRVAECSGAASEKL
jgi:hypothetical protein